MPHLVDHVLQGVSVFALSVMLVGDVKSCDNTGSYKKSLHRNSFEAGNSSNREIVRYKFAPGMVRYVISQRVPLAGISFRRLFAHRL
jgi:hypothetical protein